MHGFRAPAGLIRLTTRFTLRNVKIKVSLIANFVLPTRKKVSLYKKNIRMAYFF